LSQQWKESIIVSIYKKGNKTDCSNYTGLSLLPTTYTIVIQHSSLKVRSIRRRSYWGWSVWISK